MQEEDDDDQPEAVKRGGKKGAGTGDLFGDDGEA
jgi:hypothetical protein